MTALLVLAVFACSFALDFFAVQYVGGVAGLREHAAASASVTMCLISTVALLSVVQVSRWYLVPECLGLYLGTWFAVRRKIRAAAAVPRS